MGSLKERSRLISIEKYNRIKLHLYDDGKIEYFNMSWNSISRTEFPTKKEKWVQKKVNSDFSLKSVRDRFFQRDFKDKYIENIELSEAQIIYIQLILRKRKMDILTLYNSKTKTLLFLDIFQFFTYFPDYFSIRNPVAFSKGEEILNKLKEDDPLIVIKNKKGYCFRPIEETLKKVTQGTGEVVFLGKLVN